MNKNNSPSLQELLECTVVMTHWPQLIKRIILCPSTVSSNQFKSHIFLGTHGIQTSIWLRFAGLKDLWLCLFTMKHSTTRVSRAQTADLIWTCARKFAVKVIHLMAGDKQYQLEILIKSAPHKEIQISTTLSDLVTECTEKWQIWQVPPSAQWHVTVSSRS